LQVVALNFGSLALVQPILACDLMFAVLILWYRGHRANLKPPKVKHLLAGVAATTIGVAGFLAIGQPPAGRTQARFGVLRRHRSAHRERATRQGRSAGLQIAVMGSARVTGRTAADGQRGILAPP